MIEPIVFATPYTQGFLQSKRGSAKLHERETDLLKFTLERKDNWYYVNAWGRTSKRGEWRQVWNNRVFVSYLKALSEFNDTGAAMADWKTKLQFS